MKTLKAIVSTIAVGAYLTLTSCDSEDENVDVSQIGQSAFVISTNFVQATLKSPGSADFPLLDFTALYQGDSTYLINSYVDSQNDFGAKVRTKYKVKLKYKGGELVDSNNWELLQIETY